MSKEDHSPLTQADLAANNIICLGLNDLGLGWPVLTEESAKIPFEERKHWQRFWLVDPLDGTKEFVKRNGEFTVNIALIENGVPILGVVYAPALDVCYYGAKGEGAFMQRGILPAQAIAVKSAELGKPIKVVASRSHSDARTQALLNKLSNYDCISMGSSLKLCLVAEGAAHFYPRLGPTMEWDTAAAHAVVIAAGGAVQDREGKELVYNKPDMHNPEFFVLAGNDQSLATVIKELNE
jgi:3'(2'), 5'-bisphosphate nucleotidase